MLESTDHQSWRSKMTKKKRTLENFRASKPFWWNASKVSDSETAGFLTPAFTSLPQSLFPPRSPLPALHPSSSNRTSGWEEHRERRECLQEIGSKVAPFQRQLRGSGEDCSQEHVPQSKDTVSRREEEEEDGGRGGREGETARGRKNLVNLSSIIDLLLFIQARPAWALLRCLFHARLSLGRNIF